MKKYYLLLDNLARVKAVLYTSNEKDVLKYDNGNLGKVKTFFKKERLIKYLDSKHVNGNSYYLNEYLK